MNRLGRAKTLAVAGLATVALAVPVALAQQGGTVTDKGQGQHRQWGGGGRGGERVERGGDLGGRGFGGGMFAGLDLTDAQKAQVKQFRQSFAGGTKSLREQLRAKHEELRQAESNGTFNEALATQKLTEAAALQAKLMAAEFNLRQQMLSILTPEQKAQLDERRAQFEQKREQFKARRGASPRTEE
ncbi:MAG: Spy/CpxP family protein refolding chaperone [Acidobacteria bacterium]|nr:Spy/CpxP family protein refolding chaperone [Acidobacteriota bacterium]